MSDLELPLQPMNIAYVFLMMQDRHIPTPYMKHLRQVYY